jgi:hypothetical protein
VPALDTSDHRRSHHQMSLPSSSTLTAVAATTRALHRADSMTEKEDVEKGPTPPVGPAPAVN